MDSPTLVALIGAIGVLGGGAGLWSVFTLGATKRKLMAEADSMNAGTAALLSQSARDMLADANAARAELAAAREQLAELRQAMGELTAMMRRWRAAILDPRTSREELRVMVSGDGRT